MANYLGIGLTTDKVVWSVLKDKILSFGIEEIPKNLTAQQQVAKVYDILYSLIKNHDVSFVINKWVSFNKIKRYKAFDLVRLKERIQIACGRTNAIFIEPDTYGWEIYMAEKHRTRNKLKIIEKTYNINLYDIYPNETNKVYTDLANTIIITEGVAFGRITTKSDVLIDYDFKLNK